MSQLAIDDATIEQLRSAVGGEVITPEDAAYDEARKVWNGMIDRHPALIVRCSSTDDVVAAVNFGREHDLLVSVRGGAHSTPGYSTCDGGIVIDLQPMNGVEVDPAAATARVQGGAKWADLDGATQEHGLAVTGGRVSDTGVGGLALGSGSGWLERPYGATCESLRSAEVVTADGSVVRASADENPDLLLGPERRRRELRRRHRVRVRPAPGRPDRDGRDARVPAPAGARDHPRVPRLHGAGAEGGVRRPGADHRPARGLRSRGGARPAGRGHRLLLRRAARGGRAGSCGQLREALPEPVLDMVQPMPYAALQQMLDAGNPHGIREYFKVDYLALAAGRGDRHHRRAGGAAAGAVRPADPRPDGRRSRAHGRQHACAHDPRRAVGLLLPVDVDGPGRGRAQQGLGARVRRGDAARSGWARRCRTSSSRTRATRGCAPPTARTSTTRLVELKNKWDPDNLFRLNQNIRPVCLTPSDNVRGP